MAWLLFNEVTLALEFSVQREAFQSVANGAIDMLLREEAFP